MKGSYVRRADFLELPREVQIGVLRYELEIAETEKERADALEAVATMEAVITKLTPRPPSDRKDHQDIY